MGECVFVSLLLKINEIFGHHVADGIVRIGRRVSSEGVSSENTMLFVSCGRGPQRYWRIIHHVSDEGVRRVAGGSSEEQAI